MHGKQNDPVEKCPVFLKPKLLEPIQCQIFNPPEWWSSKCDLSPLVPDQKNIIWSKRFARWFCDHGLLWAWRLHLDQEPWGESSRYPAQRKTKLEFASREAILQIHLFLIATRRQHYQPISQGLFSIFKGQGQLQKSVQKLFPKSSGSEAGRRQIFDRE